MAGKELTRARWHNGRESRYMIDANGYVMVRRPGAMPYVMGEKEWCDLPFSEDGKKLEEQYRAAEKVQP